MFKKRTSVVPESLRKWPVDTAMMKVCTRPCILRSETKGVCTLEVGTPVVIPVLSIHRDPEHYPDPDKFDPERFSEENFEKRPRFSYLPFGAGPRGCLGSMLAATQIKSAVFTIVSHFKISTSKKTISTVTLNSMTNRDIWLVFEKRNASELF
uniref:Cytochrome P450 n=1 Tax=Timema douglasi TaxID=61478 RepID=A0A7R8VX26_TIMDO|nr:unnamed protein product [Timema douglasi]